MGLNERLVTERNGFKSKKRKRTLELAAGTAIETKDCSFKYKLRDAEILGESRQRFQ